MWRDFARTKDGAWYENGAACGAKERWLDRWRRRRRDREAELKVECASGKQESFSMMRVVKSVVPDFDKPFRHDMLKEAVDEFECRESHFV